MRQAVDEGCQGSGGKVNPAGLVLTSANRENRVGLGQSVGPAHTEPRSLQQGALTRAPN